MIRVMYIGFHNNSKHVTYPNISIEPSLGVQLPDDLVVILHVEAGHEGLVVVGDRANDRHRVHVPVDPFVSGKLAHVNQYLEKDFI